MGSILAKFRKEKSTQDVLEAIQENIEALETYTVNTQKQKKRFVGNFLAISIGLYIIAFVIFYFMYFPSTWQERIFYFTPILLFPIIIIWLRYLFTWYFQRKLNKNSTKLKALRAEKKKILEQVMDKETYKVAVNLLARFADKPSKPAIALSSATPSKSNQQQLNRSFTTNNSSQGSAQNSLNSTPKPTVRRASSNYMNSNTPHLPAQLGTPTVKSGLQTFSSMNQQLRRRTPFPIVNQQDKGVFERVVDVLIGDGPQDRFAMICKECFSHNGMALKEDFEYTTFRCAFCNALNPSRKSRPVAPRLSTMPVVTSLGYSDSESDAQNHSNESDDETEANLKATTTQFSTPTYGQNSSVNSEKTSLLSTSSDEITDEEKQKTTKNQPQSRELSDELNVTDLNEENTSIHELYKKLEKSDAAIEDNTIVSPEKNF